MLLLMLLVNLNSGVESTSHPELFDKLGDNIISLDNLDDFTEQSISNLVWGEVGERKESTIVGLVEAVVEETEVHFFLFPGS